MNLRLTACGVALVLASCGALAAECDSDKSLRELAKGLTSEQERFLKTLQGRNPSCKTFVVVLRRLASNERRGGFRLEDVRPVDLDAGRTELAVAMKDASVAARMEAIRKTESDGQVRLALEAGALDEEGFYAASGLKIAELKERLK